MTLDDFRRDVKLHWGKASTHEGKPVRVPREYDPVIGADVRAFTDEFMARGGDLQALFDSLKQTFSTTYGKLPDRAQMIKAAAAIPTPVTKREPLPVITDDETREVVDGLEDIVANLGRRAHKHVERREPWADDTHGLVTKPVEMGHSFEVTPEVCIRGSVEVEGANRSDPKDGA